MHPVRKPWTPQSRRELREILDHPTHERAVQLAGSRNSAVRATLAAAHDTPIGVLIHLSTDAHPDVRAAVAANPGVAVSVATMRRLAIDPDPRVRDAVRANMNVPVSIYETAGLARTA
ncbi:hypothetical protein [uncultured Demequina sp.]|uniref:hypothetical protein n=1 Tax=uncultured Demequina sp. TaxID=693499 RepID=UPI0025F251F2|nr:hypothetical protein [uncultured Demequina sp.]